MTEYEAAIELLKIILARDPGAAVDAVSGKERIFALFRECLDAVRGTRA
ncbi:MAG: hypothetical protein IJQ73_11420 [Kiritimatiellae bacterium]|nr:hypothetical protein [Kiritimatiellia bacterium]